MIRLRLGWVALALVAGAAGSAAAQPAQIRVTAAPTLVECRGKPCFRLQLNGYDRNGDPVPLPTDGTFDVVERETGQKHRVFFQQSYDLPARDTAAGRPASPAATAKTDRPRYAFLVVDTSGSMLEPLPGGGSKFDAAQSAIREKFVANFQEGTDRMAIVGFDSHDVKARIDRGAFGSTRAEVEQQLASLRPDPKGNTALYSALQFALGRLEQLASKDPAMAHGDILLVLFTDGANDIGRNDDSGLLQGNAGLSSVLKRTQDLSRQKQLPQAVITIGLGSGSRTYDPDVLQRLKFPESSQNFYNATNRSDLDRIFARARQEQLNRVVLTIGPVRSSKDVLVGALQFTVTLGELSTVSPSFETPPLGAATWDAPLTRPELEAYERGLDPTTAGLTDRPWWPLVRRLLILATYGLGLAGLWFGLPRLIWPERYVPRPSLQATAPPARVPGRPAAPARGPAQKGVTISTRVQPAPQQPPPGGAPPSRLREPSGAPQAAPPAPRPRETPPRPAREPYQRGAGDATVFIPPNKSPGNES